MISEWIMAVSTAVYAIVSCFMWWTIRRQAYIAKETADATRASVNAFIQTQRAQIQVRIINPIPNLVTGKIPGVRAELVNTGLTPAFHLRYETWLEILAEPFTDFTSGASSDKVDHGITIYAHAPEPTVVLFYLDSPLTDTALANLRSMKNHPCMRLRVTYEDAFRVGRWQDFGFFVAGPLGVCYLPKYNDSGECQKPN